MRLTPVADAAAFGTRLGAARRAAGMSLRELAFPGCSASYISRIEAGDRVPSLQVIHALAGRLGTSPAALLGESAEESLRDAELGLRLGDPEAAGDVYRRLAAHESPAVRGRALAGLGQIAAREGEAEQAIELLEEARSLIGAEFFASPSYVQTLGTLHARSSRFEEAVRLFEAGRATAAARGDRPAALRMALMVANSYIDLGALPESARELAEALAEAETLGDADLRARTLWSQSRLHTVEGRHDLAASFAARALAALEAADDELSVARARQLLAYIELERGGGEEALRLVESALPTIERLGDAEEKATLRLEQARALVQLGEIEDARAVALDIAPVLVATTRGDAGRLFTMLGDVWVAVGEDERALAMYDLAIDALSDHRSPHLARAYRQKAALLEARGDRDGALELLKAAVESGAASGRFSR